MRVTRSYIGRPVRLVWRDPVKISRVALKEAPSGMTALATWTEYGVIGDVTDGVVRLDHSMGEAPPGDAFDRSYEVEPTYIHEALIQEIVILAPDTAPGGVTP